MSRANLSTRLDRRGFLGASATAGVVALAGCSAVAEFLGNLALSDCNLLNATNRRFSGQLTVTDPSGTTALDAEFEVAPEDEGSGEDASFQPYDDVTAEAGSYTVTVELSGDESIDGVDQAEQSVEVTAPDDEHLMVLLGEQNVEAPIYIDAIDSLSELGEIQEEN